ncbi:MAG: sulfatase-like hydrolase/transferase, partial [Saprospiraceae bacterium]|nr:sulfatase-like hydrolase/transferase [Saprospiraceae bacterium]
QKKQAFFLYYPMILTHCPFSPTPGSPEWTTDDTTIMTYKGQAPYFQDMMAHTDKIIGKINRRLTELGVRDNTLIVFTGDNGTDKPIVSSMNGRIIAGAKGQSTDAGTRVPLVIQWPHVIKSPSICQDLVDFSDILPTLCQAAHVVVPDSLDIDGRSFMPQLNGEKGNPRTWIYNWYSRNGDQAVARVFARNHRYKLYTSGEFFDVPNDYLEQNPLDILDLNKEVLEIHTELSVVLAHYQKRRLVDVAASQ